MKIRVLSMILACILILTLAATSFAGGKHSLEPDLPAAKSFIQTKEKLITVKERMEECVKPTIEYLNDAARLIKAGKELKWLTSPSTSVIVVYIKANIALQWYQICSQLEQNK